MAGTRRGTARSRLPSPQTLPQPLLGWSLSGACLREVEERALRAANKVSTPCRQPRAVGEVECRVEALGPLAEPDREGADVGQLRPRPVVGQERKSGGRVNAAGIDTGRREGGS